MSENHDPGEQDFSRYDSMSTEELEEILRLDAEKPEYEESDTDELFYIMEVLAQRRNSDPNYTGKSVGEAFETFKKHYAPDDFKDMNIQIKSTPSAKPVKRAVRWLRPVAAVAAVLAVCILASISVDAMGFDLWGKVANWSKEFFHFEDETQTTEGTEPDMQDEIEYTSLQDALNKSNITKDLAPSWIPDGYTLTKIDIADSPKEITICAKYEKDTAKIRISVRRLLGSTPEQIEKSDDLIEIFIFDSVTYYILKNQDNLKAVWIIDEFECYISGEITIEEMKAIIESI